jgi:hypothetical protein
MRTPLLGSSESVGKHRSSQDTDLAFSRIVRHLERMTVKASVGNDLREREIRPRRRRKLQIPKYDFRKAQFPTVCLKRRNNLEEIVSLPSQTLQTEFNAPQLGKRGEARHSVTINLFDSPQMLT